MGTTNKIYIGSDNLVKLTSLKDAEASGLLDGATVVMSLYEVDTMNLAAPRLVFTSGGTETPAIGELVEGATGSATGIIKSITLTNGAWADGDAAGYFFLTDVQGTFQAEELDIPGNNFTGVATIAADVDGGKAVTIAAGADTQLHIPNHRLTASDTIRVEGTRNYDQEIAVKTLDDGEKITIDTAYVAEIFNGTEVIYKAVRGATNISLTHDGGDVSGYYDGILPDTMEKLVEGTFYYLFIKVTNAGSVLLHRLKWAATYYPFEA